MANRKNFQLFEIRCRRIHPAFPIWVKNANAGKLQTPEPFLMPESQIANSITWLEKVWRKDFFSQVA
jgi:hypothetical protein